MASDIDTPINPQIDSMGVASRYVDAVDYGCRWSAIKCLVKMILQVATMRGRRDC